MDHHSKKNRFARADNASKRLACCGAHSENVNKGEQLVSPPQMLPVTALMYNSDNPVASSMILG